MAVNLSYSVYPQDIDGYATLPLRQDGVHEIVAADHNRLRDAIVKIEQELGIQPSGTYSTVADRLDYIGDTRAITLAHIADTEDAHDASAISVVDTNNNYVEDDVESVLEELANLLPTEPDSIGVNSLAVPNSGIPSLYDGYESSGNGTRFVFNTSSADSVHKKTQPSVSTGIRGIHIIEVGDGVENGEGQLRSSAGEISFKAPGDSVFGDPVDVTSMSTGDVAIISSYDTSKKIRIARSSVALNLSGTIEESFEFYGADFVSGYFSAPSVGFQYSQHITRTAINKDATSRHQFMISGMVYPADRGTLVLQRKTRNAVADEFWPVAVLDLSNIFEESARETSQQAYIPSMSSYDTITLFDRYPVLDHYSVLTTDASGDCVYSDFKDNFCGMQVAKYLIPMSNSDIVNAYLDTPDSMNGSDLTDNVSSFRILHYKEGITDFTGYPTGSQLYSIADTTHSEFNDDNDSNTTIRYSNIFVDDAPRPGIELLNLRSTSSGFWPTDDFVDQNVATKLVSGVKYYDSDSGHYFDFELRSNNDAFNNTYVLENMLTFTSDVFSFPNGTDDGEWGAQVDLTELVDDGYVKFSESNLPGHGDQAFYLVKFSYNSDRRISPIANRFSTHSWIRATLHDPFGAGDGYDAYGSESVHRILVNSYSGTRATDAIEYFTDESKRIDDTMVFDTAIDGYSLTAFDYNNPLPTGSLHVGGKFDSPEANDGSIAEFNIPGLIYPQTDYYNLAYRIKPDQIDNSLMNYSARTGDCQYQRLFSLGYPISGGRLQITSGGYSPISFNDIRWSNPNRCMQISVKIPGNGTNSTEWLDIGRLFSTGDYEDGYGALHGEVTGEAGDLTVPFTFGPRHTGNNYGYSIDYAIAARVIYFGTTAEKIQVARQKIMTMIQLLP